MEPSALTVNTMPNSSRSWRSRRGAHETTKYAPVLRFAPQRGKIKWLCCADPGSAPSAGGLYGTRCRTCCNVERVRMAMPAGGRCCGLLAVCSEAALARVGRGGAAAADPFGRGDSVAVSLGGVRFRLPHDLHALDRDDRTDYTPPGRGGRKSAAFCLSDGGTVRGALRGGCSPFTDGLRHCADRFFERAAVAASTGAGRELDGTLSVRGTVPADWKHPTECDRVFVKGRLTSRSWAACSSASGSSGNAQRERVFRVAGGERGCAAPAAL